MKKTILALSLFILGWTAPLSAEIMTYQGRLKESNIPVNANRSFGFELCATDTPSGCVPSPDGAKPFAVQNGLFKSTFTLPAVDLAAGPWYLRVEVEGAYLSPVERLTFVPYSIFSSSAGYSFYSSTAGYSAAAVQKAGDTMTGQLTLAGASFTVTSAQGLRSAANTFADNVVISSSSASAYGGIFVSTHVYLPTGAKYYGDGSGLTGVTGASGTDSSKVLKTGDTMTGRLTAPDYTANYGVTASTGLFSAGIIASSYTATGTGVSAAQLRLGDNVFISSEANQALGGGVNISTNVYIVGFSSAAKFYGNGSNLIGVMASAVAAANIAAGNLLNTVIASSVAISGFYSNPAIRSNLGVVGIAGDTMTGQLTNTSSITITGNGGVYGLQVSSNVSLAGALYSANGNVGIGLATPGAKLTLPYNGYLGWDANNNGDGVVVHSIGKAATGATPLQFLNNGNPGPAGRQFSFLSQGVEILTLLDNGNVGVSTIAPVNKLAVQGGILAASSITAQGGFFGDGSGLTGLGSAVAAGTAANLAGGAIGEIPYQAALNTTAMLAAGITGQILQANTGIAPSWTATPAILGTNITAIPGANITGNISGSAGTAAALATARAINGVNFDGSAAITVPVNSTDDTSNATTMYPLWTTGIGNVGAKISSTKLSFVPNTGILSATGFAGPLTGNVTGNVSGNAATVTTNANLTGGVTSVGNAATVVTNANLTGDVTSVGNATTLANAPVIAKVLTGFVSGAGAVAATDSILQAVQKLDGNDGARVLKAGDTMTGQLTNTSSVTITGNGGVYGLQVSSNVSLAGALYSANGNVGIGTLSPQAPFEVSGAGGNLATITGLSVNTRLRVDAPTGSSAELELTGAGGITNGWSVVRAPTTYDLEFREGGSTPAKLFLKYGTGNTGIGTIVPDQKLTVAGNISQTGVLISSGAGNNYFAGGISASSITLSGGITASSFTATGIGLGAAQLRLSAENNLVISSETSSALGAGLRISTNVYVVGFSSAAKYFGDGSGLTGVTANDPSRLPLAGGAMAGDLTMGGNNIYSASTITATGDITAARYQINGSTVLASVGTNALAVGLEAGKSNMAANNTYVGYGAGRDNISGNSNVFVGDWAGVTTTGGGNTFVGSNAGLTNVAGTENTFVGKQAGYFNVGGNQNSFFGALAGSKNNSGIGNAYFGYSSGLNATTASGNSFFGSNSGSITTIGGDNAFFGANAGYNNLTGQGNVYLGRSAAFYNAAGTAGVIIGYQAGGNNAGSVNSFSSSTVVGYQAGFNLLAGSADNIFIGYQSGYNVTTGTGNIVIGYGKNTSIAGASNELNIGGVIYGNLSSGGVGIGVGVTNPAGALQVGQNGLIISTGGAIQTTGLGHGSTAGAARGTGAVDLQTFRTLVGQVASGPYSVVAGGYGNSATVSYAFAGGGYNNSASGGYSVVGGGNGNQSSNGWTTVGGGQSNIASQNNATVGGGSGNNASSYAATIAGGYGNAASGDNSTIAGGISNSATGWGAAIGGGGNNVSTGAYSTVGGGRMNTSSGTHSAVLGGYANVAQGAYSSVAGGRSNLAAGYTAAALGTMNASIGDYSFSAGYKSTSAVNGTFTWADSSGEGVVNNIVDQVMFKAKGGFWVSTGTVYTNPAIYVDANNKVGIGTAFPAAKLHLAEGGIMFPDGTLQTTAGVGSASNLTSTTDAVINGDSDGDTIGSVRLQTAYLDRVYVSTAGNVGIGTVSPLRRLHVEGAVSSGSPVLIRDSASGYGTSISASWPDIGLNQYFDGSNTRAIGAGFGGSITLEPGTGKMYFNTGNNPGAGNIAVNNTRMTLLTSGDIGIGTITPAAMLDVNGTVKLSRQLVESRDAGGTMTAADFGKTITVNSVSAQAIMLPFVTASDIGAQFTFVKLGAGQVTIQAYAANFIADSTSGGTIYNNLPAETYAAITLRLTTGTMWTIMGGNGSWTTN